VIGKLVETLKQTIIGALATSRQQDDRFRLLYDDLLVSQQIAKYGEKYIAKHTTHLFSQTYEDAVVAEIFSRIGTKSKTFVEIGVEDGSENTTRLLLMLGWKGLWIEGNPTHAASIRRNFSTFIDSGQLKVVNSFVETDNVQSLIDQAGLGAEIDYLSVDIDQNTSHVFRAIKTKARVACIEYNAHFPPSIDYEVPYRVGAVWDAGNWYGGSLKTIVRIASERKMSLVGCDLMGVNAYFVQSSLTGSLFPKPYTSEHHYQPPRFSYVGGARGHRRSSPSSLNVK